MMKHHPYSDIWPLMSGKDFEALKADILAAGGLRLPVLIYKNRILDGRNRERACNETGIQVRYEQAKATTDAEALALVVSLNDHRRHLSKDQRALAASELANIIHGHNQHIEKIVDISRDNSTISAEAKKANQPISVVAAARVMNVSPIRLARMRGVKAHGGQSAVDEVLSGKAKLFKKYNEVKPKRVPRIKPLKRAKPGRPRKNEPKRKLVISSTPAAQALTRKQVDPEFTGTPTEFVDKYGLVQNMTAEQYATMRFADWVSNVRALAKRWRELPELREVDHNWLRKPDRRDIAKLTEALEYLRPKLAEAEALLARAVTATKEKVAS